MLTSKPEAASRKRFRLRKDQWPKIAISFFIIFHLYAVLLWLCPDCPLRARLLPLIENYLLYTGLWQTFAVFSPDPRSVNLDLSAAVTFKDGTVRLWQYPRMEHLSIPARIQKERYRKMGNDHLNWDENRLLWPDAARYIARMHGNSENPPVSISLIRHWSQIPPPGKKGGPLINDNGYTFFVYRVQDRDLP